MNSTKLKKISNYKNAAFSQFIEPTNRVCVDENTVWDVPHRLKLIEKIGSGSYGIVASFLDQISSQEVAVKKIGDAFKDLFDAKRILREIRILRYLNHTNIIKILDIFPPKSPNFEDIYLVSDLMKMDLQRLIKSKQELTDGHLQYFTYQILRGLLYLHSANVLHRDLKPGNILINLNCDLKICDFGLSRGIDSNTTSTKTQHNEREIKQKETEVGRWGRFSTDFRVLKTNGYGSSKKLITKHTTPEETSTELTEYVVTRWYRSPEITLYPHHYDKAIDVWSVGCIFGELLGREALFAGHNSTDQLWRIVNILGTPDEDDLSWLPSGPSRDNAIKRLKKFPQSNGQRFRGIFPNASNAGIDLLERLLTFNPENRISVEEALRHEYFSGLHSSRHEPLCPAPLDWSFDNLKPTKRVLQNRIYEEIAYYNPAIAIRDWHCMEKYGIQINMSNIINKLTSDESSNIEESKLLNNNIRQKSRQTSSSNLKTHKSTNTSYIPSSNEVERIMKDERFEEIRQKRSTYNQKLMYRHTMQNILKNTSIEEKSTEFDCTSKNYINSRNPSDVDTPFITSTPHKLLYSHHNNCKLHTIETHQTVDGECMGDVHPPATHWSYKLQNNSNKSKYFTSKLKYAADHTASDNPLLTASYTPHVSSTLLGRRQTLHSNAKRKL